MQVGELIENALYLSLKDRYFDALPDATKDDVLTGFLANFNTVLAGISKRNAGTRHVTVKTGDLLEDKDLNVKYVDLTKNPFSNIFRVEFLYAGGVSSITLSRLGLNDFFSNSNVRTLNTYPVFYNYNIPSGKLYVYPTPSVGGNINIFGKARLGPFSSIESDFPEEMSDAFEMYVQYFFAKWLCSQFNAPWQAQKEEILKNYRALVDSENNNAYQTNSLEGSKFSLPIRNTRIGL